VTEVQQLVAVTVRYLQHCFEQLGEDFKVPNHGEGTISYDFSAQVGASKTEHDCAAY
jgi:hypothetical protein